MEGLSTPVAALSSGSATAAEIVALPPLLSAALETSLDLKGRDRSPSFESSVRRSVNYLIAELGDKPINRYSRKDALGLRDAFMRRQLSVTSIKRNFNNINALTGLVCRELGHPAPATLVGHHSARSQNKLTYGLYSAGISDEQKREIVEGVRVPER